MTTIARAVEPLSADNVVERIWAKDHTLWSDSPTEITDRLGWLDITDTMRGEVTALTRFAHSVRDEDIRHVVLLGMGGSSLGAEVLNQSFGPREGWPELVVLDSTLPAQVNLVADSINIECALFVVSSKSGTTAEPRLLYRLFRHRLNKLGFGGEKFIAITDPGSPLEQLAIRDGFRKIFLNAPDICGRYSVLSYFGLVPAALAGYDVAGILESGEQMRSNCAVGIPTGDNPGAHLGATITSHTEAGRDKLTLLTSPSLDSFGLWAEQLIAESLGKKGRGIAPVTLEPPGNVLSYGHDRQFVFLKLSGEDSPTDTLASDLAHAGHPVIRYEIKDVNSLGGEFYRWEFAIATAGAMMGVNPFDQPDVQRAKDLTQRSLEAFKASGDTAILTAQGTIAELTGSLSIGDYIAILAYVPQTPQNDDALSRLREAILRNCRVPTTLGYGPRYLHSTGQLHKGGPNSVAALMIVSPHEEDVAIPGENFTFGALTDAQAAADLRVLQDAGRRTACVKLTDETTKSIDLLTQSL